MERIDHGAPFLSMIDYSNPLARPDMTYDQHEIPQTFSGNFDLDMIFANCPTPSYGLIQGPTASGYSWNPSRVQHACMGGNVNDGLNGSYQVLAQLDHTGGMSSPGSNGRTNPHAMDNQPTAAIPETASNPVPQADTAAPSQADAATLSVKKRRTRKKKNKPSEMELKAKRERFLERNRQAAAKCRTKKKEWSEGLESQCQELQASKKVLIEHIAELKDELEKLKFYIQQHSNCNHRLVDDWMKRQVAVRRNSGQSSISEHTASSSYDGSRSNSIDDSIASTGPLMSPQLAHEFEIGNICRFSGDRRMSCQDSRGIVMSREDSRESMASDGFLRRDSGISDMGTPTKQDFDMSGNDAFRPSNPNMMTRPRSPMLRNTRLHTNQGFFEPFAQNVVGPPDYGEFLNLFPEENEEIF